MEPQSRIGYLMEELKLELSRSSHKYESVIENLKLENRELRDSLSQTNDKINLLHQQMNAIQQENSSLRNQKQKLKHVVLRVKQKQKNKKDISFRNALKAKDESDNRESILSTSPIEHCSEATPSGCSNRSSSPTEQINNSTIVSSEDSINIDSKSNDYILNPIVINVITPPTSSNNNHPESIFYSNDDAMKNVQRIITERHDKVNVKENVRKQEYRNRLPTKACEQCQAYFGNDFEHINHTCRHRYIGGSTQTTPEGYWNIGRPKTFNNEKDVKSKNLFK